MSWAAQDSDDCTSNGKKPGGVADHSSSCARGCWPRGSHPAREAFAFWSEAIGFFFLRNHGLKREGQAWKLDGHVLVSAPQQIPKKTWGRESCSRWGDHVSLSRGNLTRQCCRTFRAQAPTSGALSFPRGKTGPQEPPQKTDVRRRSKYPFRCLLLLSFPSAVISSPPVSQPFLVTEKHRERSIPSRAVVRRESGSWYSRFPRYLSLVRPLPAHEGTP